MGNENMRSYGDLTPILHRKAGSAFEHQASAQFFVRE